MFPIKAGNSIDVQKLVEVLKTVDEGQMITYADLTAAIGGRDVSKKYRYLLDQARRFIQREHEIVFAAEKNIGLIRLDDVGKSSIGKQTIVHIRRSAKRGCEKMSCVKDFDAMPEEAKAEHNFGMSVLGAIAASTKKKPLLAIEAKTRTATMPTADVLRELAG